MFPNISITHLIGGVMQITLPIEISQNKTLNGDYRCV